MYQMIHAQIVSMYELQNCYSLDDALKLYAIFKMNIDIQSCKNKELAEKTRRMSKR